MRMIQCDMKSDEVDANGNVVLQGGVESGGVPDRVRFDDLAPGRELEVTRAAEDRHRAHGREVVDGADAHERAVHVLVGGDAGEGVRHREGAVDVEVEHLEEDVGALVVAPVRQRLARRPVHRSHHCRRRVRGHRQRLRLHQELPVRRVRDQPRVGIVAAGVVAGRFECLLAVDGELVAQICLCDPWRDHEQHGKHTQ